MVTLTSNSLVEDSGRGTEVEWTTSWVDIATFAQVSQVLDLVSVEMTRKVQFFATNYSNLATLQQVFGNDGSQAADQVATTINNNGLKGNKKKLEKSFSINNIAMCSIARV